MKREPDNDSELHAELQALRQRVAEMDANMARLRDELQRDRMFVEAADEGLWVIDAKQRTVQVNSHMARMLGTTVEAMLGTSLFDFMDEIGSAQCREILEPRGKGVGEPHDFVFVRRDGGRVHASMRTSPIIDAAGIYQGSVALVADVAGRFSRSDRSGGPVGQHDFHRVFPAGFGGAENRGAAHRS